MKINLVMIVRNEERCLKRCLEAAASFVDEIILVDTGSEDRTLEAAEAFGMNSSVPVMVYTFPWTNDFAAARNYALERSETDGEADYHLVLDADETMRVTAHSSRTALEDFIRRMEEQHDSAWCGAIRLFEQFRGEAGEPDTGILLVPRIFPAGIRYKGIIREQPDTDVPCISSSIAADHDDSGRDAKNERDLPLLLRAFSAAPSDPYQACQMALIYRKMGRLKESLPYFSLFYQEVLKAYPDISDRTPYPQYYIRNGIIQYLYTLMNLRQETYLNKALHIAVRQEPHMQECADFYYFCGLFYMNLVTANTQQYITYLPRVEQSFVHCLQIGEHPDRSIVIGTGSFKAFYNLGRWYELTGQMDHAKVCYESAARMNYEPAIRRTELLEGN